MWKNVERGDCLRTLRFATGREQIEECADEFFEEFRLLGAIDNDEQRSLDSLPEQDEIDRFGRRRQSRKRQAPRFVAIQFSNEFFEGRLATKILEKSRTAGWITRRAAEFLPPCSSWSIPVPAAEPLRDRPRPPLLRDPR